MKALWLVLTLLGGMLAWADEVELIGSDTVASLIEPYQAGFTESTGHRLKLRVTGSLPALVRTQQWPGGIMLSEPFPAHPVPYLSRIGSDAVVFLVNRRNPLRALTLKELEALLQPGARWPDGRPVVLYSLGVNHATMHYVRQFFGATGSPQTLHTQRTPELVIANVADDAQGLGWLSLGRLQREALSGVGMLTLEGESPLQPDRRLNPAYPLHRNLYIGFSRTPNGAEQALLDYLKAQINHGTERPASQNRAGAGKTTRH